MGHARSKLGRALIVVSPGVFGVVGTVFAIRWSKSKAEGRPPRP